MGTNEVAVGLSALGFVFEAGGLATVVREIAGDRDRARQLLSKPRKHSRPQRSYPGRVSPSSQVVVGSPIDRMQPGAAEKRTQANLAALANGLINMRKAVDKERDDLEEKLLGEIDQGYDELRADLRDVLVGAYRLRRLGAGALGFGILLSAADSIIGNIT